MRALTKLEIKKIRKSRSTVLSMAILLAYILTAIIGSVLAANFDMVDSNKEFKEIKGTEAIREKRKEIKKVEGYLNREKISDVVNYFKLIHRSYSESGLKEGEWKAYDGMNSILIKAFSELNNFDPKIVNKLSAEEAQELYRMRVKRIEERLNQYINKKKFTQEDKLHVLEKAEELKTPIYYKYFDGWPKLMDNFFFLNVFIIILICFSITKVFTEDVSSKMWMIVRASVNGRKKLAYSKIKGSIVISSIIFIVGNLVFFVPLMIFYGIEGWDCAIQIRSHYLFSVYNINFLQAYIFGLIIAFTVCIFMAMLTLLLSNIFKKALFGITSTIAIFFAPFLINSDKLGKHLNNFLGMMPARALDVDMNLRNNYILNINGKGILLMYVKPLILIAMAMIMIPVIVRCYEKQEI